jgi:hypothetical protein
MPDPTSKNKIEITSKDGGGNDITFAIVRPNAAKIRRGQLEYNKSFRAALESGALLRQKLESYMREQGLWDDKKEKEYTDLTERLNQQEITLAKGGIRLTEAREVAMKMRLDRIDFRELIGERNSLDNNTVEGQSDNARFNFLVYECMIDVRNGKPLFSSFSEYDDASSEPYVVEAAGELASLMYNLDPDYDKNLPENKFLKDYDFINDDLHLVDKDGRPCDIDGRLVNDNGRLINEDGQLVDRQGNLVDEDANYVIKQKPFMDDSGGKIPIPKNETETEEEEEAVTEESEESEETATKEEEAPKTKKGRKKKTTEASSDSA